MTKRCTNTIDWLNSNYGIDIEPENNTEHNVDSDPINVVDSTIISSVELNSVNVPDSIILEAENEILKISTVYANNEDFIGDDPLTDSRFIAFKKNTDGQVTILSIPKEEVEGLLLNITTLKEALPNYFVLPQNLKDLDYGEIIAKNEAAIDTFKKKYQEKININPIELLNSIEADSSNNYIVKEPNKKRNKKTK